MSVLRISDLPTYYRERIEKSEDGCWLWKGGKKAPGYGVAFAGYGPDQAGKKGYARSKLAHRAVYELLVRELLPAEVCDHTCPNKLCVNPAHLEIHPSQREHMQRHQRAWNPPESRATPDEKRSKTRAYMKTWRTKNRGAWRKIWKRHEAKRQHQKRTERWQAAFPWLDPDTIQNLMTVHHKRRLSPPLRHQIERKHPRPSTIT